MNKKNSIKDNIENLSLKKEGRERAEFKPYLRMQMELINKTTNDSQILARKVEEHKAMGEPDYPKGIFKDIIIDNQEEGYKVMLSQNKKFREIEILTDAIEILGKIYPYRKFSKIAKHVQYLQNEIANLHDIREEYDKLDKKDKEYSEMIVNFPGKYKLFDSVLDTMIEFAQFTFKIAPIAGIIFGIISAFGEGLVSGILYGIIGTIIFGLAGGIVLGLIGAVVGCVRNSKYNSENEKEKQKLFEKQYAVIKEMYKLDNEYRKRLYNLKSYYMN